MVLTESKITVEGLRILKASSNTLQAAWNRPNVAAEIDYYQVQWYLENDVHTCKVSNVTNDNVSMVEIPSLRACTNYTVKVTPHMKLSDLIGAESTTDGITGLEGERCKFFCFGDHDSQN